MMLRTILYTMKFSIGSFCNFNCFLDGPNLHDEFFFFFFGVFLGTRQFHRLESSVCVLSRHLHLILSPKCHSHERLFFQCHTFRCKILSSRVCCACVRAISMCTYRNSPQYTVRISFFFLGTLQFHRLESSACVL